MLERLEAVVARYEELSRLLCDPEVVNDPEKLRTYAKEQADLEETVTTYRAYKRVCEELEQAEAMLEEKLDDELRALVKEEISSLTEQKEALETQLKRLLLPKDPNDEKNVIVEIRAAAGGEESALFAADLFRMYTRYAERKGYRTEILEAHPTDLGGFKEVIFTVQGRGAYSRLKFESGAHRVQRIPVTESGGRIHTSTATVAVLPEMEEVEVEIDEKDLRIDTFRASGHGGQHVNKTESAVRITHLRRELSFRARTRSRRSKTAKRRCACCAPGSTSSTASSGRQSWPTRAGAWSAPASAASASAPTISPKTA